MTTKYQKPNFPLPKGIAHVEWPQGGVVIKDYGKYPCQPTYNPDRGQRWPRDPQRGRDAPKGK